MSSPTVETASLLATIDAHRAALESVLARDGATNPRLFGSVARGEAGSQSDIDVLVDLAPNGSNALLQLAGIGEEFGVILGTRVDVVSSDILRDPVSRTAMSDAIPL